MKHIKVTSSKNITTVSLNRPEKRNAFHPEMIRELTTAFKKIGKDKNARAVILTGEGQSFCSGGDLEWMKSMAKFSAKENLKDANELFDMYWTIRNCPVPVIGKVFGHCFGGGAGLVAVCDIVVAENETQFCFSEVKWGLVPAVISPFVSEKASVVHTREWFLTAKVFRASEARAGGLINYCGHNSEVEFYLEETLKALNQAGPEAVRETKKTHQSYSTINWKKTKTAVTKLIAKRRVSAEGQKGLKAFLEKRTPQWNEESNGKNAKD